jgi:hypothetical protein
MPDNLIDITLEDGAAAPKAKGTRPADVPEKFWDEEAGGIRVDALLKSYRELEKRLSRMVTLPGDDADEEERFRFLRALGVPETADAYTIEERHPLVTPDKDVNARLHKAGFTPQQVQLVYDLAAERLLPLIAEAAQMFEAERDRSPARSFRQRRTLAARGQAARRLGTRQPRPRRVRGSLLDGLGRARPAHDDGEGRACPAQQRRARGEHGRGRAAHDDA